MALGRWQSLAVEARQLCALISRNLSGSGSSLRTVCDFQRHFRASGRLEGGPFRCIVCAPPCGTPGDFPQLAAGAFRFEEMDR